MPHPARRGARVPKYSVHDTMERIAYATLAAARPKLETVGEWNHRQVFDERGILFMIVTLNCGHFCVVRMVEADLPNATVVSDGHFDSEVDVIAEAERLRKAALT